MSIEKTNHWLMHVSVGPVGGFIGAGRRSRDLWYGSRLVSELTRVVTRKLVTMFEKDQIELVMPLPGRIDVSFLEKHKGPTISNHVHARVHGASETEVNGALEEARRTARGFLARQIEKCADDSRFVEIASRKILMDQAAAVGAGDFVEVYAAAVRYDDENDPNGEVVAIHDVRTCIEGLKAMRTYLIPATRPGVPKSSMDGGWDSALYEASKENEYKVLEFVRNRRGIRHEERLDAVGLVRRRAVFDAVDGNLPTLPFPPLARVTAEPWIQGVSSASRRTLQRIVRALDDLRRSSPDALMLIATPCREPGKELDTIPTIFGYDPSLLFEGGLDALKRELEHIEESKRRQQRLGEDHRVQNAETRVNGITESVESARKLLEAIRPDVVALHQEHQPPQPYYALIEADGDGIGTLLEAARGWDHTSLVQALYDFADGAWEVVEKHGGTAFYVGGDELTAYLPLDQAFETIRELVELFKNKVGKRAAECGVSKENLPTLSVGMVVAHVKDDLRSVRRKARGALRDAKNRRAEGNAGGSFLHGIESVRGGSDRHFGGLVDVLIENIEHWQRLLRNEREMSLSMVHAWLGLMERKFGDKALIELVCADLVQRSKRSNREPNKRLEERLKAIKDLLCEEKRTCEKMLTNLVHEILFASRLVDVIAQRTVGRSGKEAV